MMRPLLAAALTMGFLGCHAKPERVAREYLTALSAADLGKAREMVIPDCHEAPEGMGTLLSREGYDVRHAMIDVFVDTQDETTATVSYEVRGSLHSLTSSPSMEIGAQSGADTTPGAYRHSGTLLLEKDHDGWHIACVR